MPSLTSCQASSGMTSRREERHHCPLSVVRCPLSVVRCPLSVVRCPLSVVRCPLRPYPIAERRRAPGRRPGRAGLATAHNGQRTTDNGQLPERDRKGVADGGEKLNISGGRSTGVNLPPPPGASVRPFEALRGAASRPGPKHRPGA